MGILIDSSVLIEVKRRNMLLQVFLDLLPEDETLAIAAVAAAELLVGTHLRREAERSEREDSVEEVLRALEVVPFDIEIARLYARIWAELRSTGLIVAAHDLQIGATALYLGYPVMTQNMRHFERIPGLEVRRPAWP